MADATAPLIRTVRAGRHVEILLDNPGGLNTFTPRFQQELVAALDAAAENEACGAVILAGTGRTFCVGQDLRERDPRKWTAPPDLTRSVRNFYNPLIRRIRAMPMPTVCAVNGIAAGAGVGIALACDIVLASDKARFILAFSRIGLVPDGGTSWHLARRLGEARALALTLTGGELSATEAAEGGLIWKAFADEGLMDEARALAGQLADGPRYGLTLAREAIRAAAGSDLDTQLELEAELQGRAARSPDYAEGVLAFLEKRPARFTGEGERDPAAP